MKMKKKFYTFLTILVIILASYNANANTVLFENSVLDKSIAPVPNSKFDLPKITLDQDCFILLYSDRDPSPKAIEHYQLFAPNGEQVIDNKKEIKSASKTWVGYAGKRNNSQRPLALGKWKSQYSLTRGNKVLIDVRKEVQLT